MNRRATASTPLVDYVPADAILVVNGEIAKLRQTQHLLTAAGYSVIATTSFEEAKSALDDPRVAMVITAIRLGPYNGLHLAHRARLVQPALPVLVTYEVHDAYFAEEAARCGAEFVALTPGDSEIVRRVVQVTGAPETRREPRARRLPLASRASLASLATTASFAFRPVDTTTLTPDLTI